MSKHTEGPIPRAMIVGAAVLIGATFVLAAVGRVSGVGTTRVASGEVIESRALRFEDRGDGSVVVLEAPGDRVVDVLAPGTHGFVRGVMRGLARERRKQKVGSGPAFRLDRYIDGRLSLHDPVTGREINLEVFGDTNARSFARLLHVNAAMTRPGTPGGPAQTASL